MLLKTLHSARSRLYEGRCFPGRQGFGTGGQKNQIGQNIRIRSNIRTGRDSLLHYRRLLLPSTFFLRSFESVYRCQECCVFYVMLSLQESECFCLKAKACVTCDFENTLMLKCSSSRTSAKEDNFKNYTFFSFLLKLIKEIYTG